MQPEDCVRRFNLLRNSSRTPPWNRKLQHVSTIDGPEHFVLNVDALPQPPSRLVSCISPTSRGATNQATRLFLLNPFPDHVFAVMLLRLITSDSCATSSSTVFSHSTVTDAMIKRAFVRIRLCPSGSPRRKESKASKGQASCPPSMTDSGIQRRTRAPTPIQFLFSGNLLTSFDPNVPALTLDCSLHRLLVFRLVHLLLFPLPPRYFGPIRSDSFL